MWDDAVEAIKKSKPDSRIFVGCDSIRIKVRGKKKYNARYSTVIAIHHTSGTSRIFSQTDVQPDYGNLRARMLNEVNYAVQAASAVIDHLDGREMEIHLDINTDPSHKSNIAMKEAQGWVKGMFGFEPKMKPDAWCATHVSDHIAREKHLS